MIASRTVRMILSGSLLCGAMFLAGCGVGSSSAPQQAVSGLAIRGVAHGGQQPIAGAHIYMLAANTTGYGAASLSLLDPLATGLSDSVGAYVTTDANGNFDITGDYTCTPGQQVYLYALGGDPGAGVNSAAGLMAVLGNCPSAGNFLSATPYVFMNEVSTVAAAYAMSGYATDATHVSSSGTDLAKQGVAYAFSAAANLADLGSGTALVTTPAGNGTNPQTSVNTVANILSSCINSDGPGSSMCAILLANAQSAGSTGTVPTDTATAAIDMAHNPAANVSALYAIVPAIAPFAPSAATQPNDFLLAISYTGGGLNAPAGISVDGNGNIWAANYGTGANSLSVLSPLGAALSPAGGYTGTSLTSLTGPVNVAPDPFGNAWAVTGTTVNELNGAGTQITGALGLTGGGLILPVDIAVDGLGNVWVATANADVAKFSNSGTALSSVLGYTGGGLAVASDIAIDGSGDVWVANTLGNVSKISSAGTAISGVLGYTGGGLSSPQKIALDGSGNAWISNASNSVSKLASDGTALSPVSGFTGGGLSTPRGVAIDGGGNVWVANSAGPITELSNAGVPLSPSNGFMFGYFNAGNDVAIDASGNVWLSSGNTLKELVGAAVPVVVPLSVGVKYNTLGTRP